MTTRSKKPSAFDRPVDRILERLRHRDLDYRQQSDPSVFKAQCPAHDDRTPSLSIKEAADGRALIHCFAGCEGERILAALDLDWPDLFPAGMRSDNGRRPERRSDLVEHLTDLGNARRFARQHGRHVRFDHTRGKWHVWSGRRWRLDERGEVERLAKDTVASIYAEATDAADADLRKRIAEHGRRSEAEARIKAMLALARSESAIPVTPNQLDRDPFLLTCPNGTIDLRTGELRGHDPADLITRGTEVMFEPGAQAPRWRRFLEEVFGGDRELIAFVKRAAGYALTGDTREHVLFVCHGSGCNGKSTYIETMKRLLGDLALTAAFDTFARTRGDRGPRNDLARLHRARLVAASESGAGRRLDEATVKALTGGDTVAARHLYADFFEFRPEFKLWLVTNHRPRVDGGDDAIWRRIRLVPFEESFEGCEDRELPAKLKEELPGILAWAVEGCVEWQRDGLGQAGAIERATTEYRHDEDTLGAFIEERCERTGEVAAVELRDAYEKFCGEVGERPISASALGQQLAKRGFESKRASKGRRIYGGVSLS